MVGTPNLPACQAKQVQVLQTQLPWENLEKAHEDAVRALGVFPVA